MKHWTVTSLSADWFTFYSEAVGSRLPWLSVGGSISFFHSVQSILLYSTFLLYLLLSLKATMPMSKVSHSFQFLHSVALAQGHESCIWCNISVFLLSQCIGGCLCLPTSLFFVICCLLPVSRVHFKVISFAISIISFEPGLIMLASFLCCPCSVHSHLCLTAPFPLGFDSNLLLYLILYTAPLPPFFPPFRGFWTRMVYFDYITCLR